MGEASSMHHALPRTGSRIAAQPSVMFSPLRTVRDPPAPVSRSAGWRPGVADIW